jgi:hypothetical protein
MGGGAERNCPKEHGAVKIAQSKCRVSSVFLCVLVVNLHLVRGYKPTQPRAAALHIFPEEGRDPALPLGSKNEKILKSVSGFICVICVHQRQDLFFFVSQSIGFGRDPSLCSGLKQKQQVNNCWEPL